MQRQRQETSTVTQGIQLCSAGPEQQSCAVLLPKGQQGFGHRDSSQRWKTKRQITSENNGKQELFILDTSQGLENMKVKIKEKRFLTIWRWKTKVLVGCERKNRVIRTQILMAHRMTSEKDTRHIQFAAGSWLHLPNWGFNPNDKAKTEYYSVTAECELFQGWQQSKE